MAQYHKRQHYRPHMRTIHIRNVATRISPHHGALLIWCSASAKGSSITISGRERITQTVVPHHHNGRTQFVANFPGLEPCLYTIETTGFGHYNEHISIIEDFVTQLDWS